MYKLLYEDGKNNIINQLGTVKTESESYMYDGGGNILRKKEYESSITSGGKLLKTYEYGYSSTHKDRLISFNGQSISYNSFGYKINKQKEKRWKKL